MRNTSWRSVLQNSMEMPGIWNTRDNWHIWYKENM